MRPPYEPLSGACLKHITLKCVFLLALASGRRRGDIHALSVLRWSRGYSSVSLNTDPNFLAKNQLHDFVPEAICILSLSSVVGNCKRDRILCPIRALHFYLDKMKGGRGSRSHFFLPIKAGQEDISAQSISRWIVKVIKFSYESSSDQSLKFLKSGLMRSGP